MTAGTDAAISVVVPSRDRHALLRRALSSILSQDHPAVEVIVVDDGSVVAIDERTVPELAEFSGRVDVVRNEQSRGVAAARNRGIDAVATEFVAFLDDDDLWAPTKLSSQLAPLLGSPGTGWACTGEIVVDPELRVIRASAPPALNPLYPHLLASNVIPGGGSGVMASTDLLRSVGSFDPSLSALADWDLWIRLAERSGVATVPEPLVAYVVAPGSLAHNIVRSRAELARLRDKYHDDRIRCGVALDERSFEWYFGEHELRSGRRLAAARTHLRLAARYRSWRALRVALAGTLWGGFQSLRDHRHWVEAKVHAETGMWLDDYRTRGGDLDTLH